MAAGDTPITVVGNLVADPELRFTPAGQPVATFRVASTPRMRDAASGEWKDGDSLFLTCNVWRQAAENVAESLQRGMRVIVSGRLRQRSYETQQGEKRTVSLEEQLPKFIQFVAFPLLGPDAVQVSEYWQIVLGPLYVLVVLYARGGIDGLLAGARRA